MNHHLSFIQRFLVSCQKKSLWDIPDRYDPAFPGAVRTHIFERQAAMLHNSNDTIQIYKHSSGSFKSGQLSYKQCPRIIPVAWQLYLLARTSDGCCLQIFKRFCVEKWKAVPFCKIPRDKKIIVMCVCLTGSYIPSNKINNFWTEKKILKSKTDHFKISYICESVQLVCTAPWWSDCIGTQSL